MPGLVPGIHAFAPHRRGKWIPGTGAAMTEGEALWDGVRPQPRLPSGKGGWVGGAQRDRTDCAARGPAPRPHKALRPRGRNERRWSKAVAKVLFLSQNQ